MWILTTLIDCKERFLTGLFVGGLHNIDYFRKRRSAGSLHHSAAQFCLRKQVQYYLEFGALALFQNTRYLCTMRRRAVSRDRGLPYGDSDGNARLVAT